MLVVISLLSIYLHGVFGHGMMLDPPNRSSLWRFNFSAPINYDDDQNYCGGMTVSEGDYFIISSINYLGAMGLF